MANLENDTLVKSQSEANTPVNPQKKNGANTVAIIICALAAIVVIAAVALGVLFFMATSDDMPKAPEITTDMSTIVKDSAVEMIKDKKISFTSDKVNMMFKTVVEKSADKMAENGVTIDDLFTVINNDKAVIYCRARYKGVKWPIRAVATLSYDDPNILIGFSSAQLGKLSLPTETLMDYIGKNISVEDVSIHNSCIYYDTTTFNDKLSEMTLKSLGISEEDLRKEQEQNEKNNEENKGEGFSIGKWWSNLVNNITHSVKDWAAGLVSDFIHDIHFQDVKIIDNEIVITVKLGDEEASPNEASADSGTEELQPAA